LDGSLGKAGKARHQSLEAANRAAKSPLAMNFASAACGRMKAARPFLMRAAALPHHRNIWHGPRLGEGAKGRDMLDQQAAVFNSLIIGVARPVTTAKRGCP